MHQRTKEFKSTSTSSSPSSPHLKDIDRLLEDCFHLLTHETASFLRQMKDLISSHLDIDIKEDWEIEGVSTPTVKDFKEVTALLNQDLQTILGMAKVLLGPKVQLPVGDSNEYKILKSCAGVNQLSRVLEEVLTNNEILLDEKTDLMELVKSLSDNIYSYESLNPEFNDLLQDFASKIPQPTLQVPYCKVTKSIKASRLTQRSQSSTKQNKNLRKIIINKEEEFYKNNEEFSICIEEYNQYIYELKDEISSLNQELDTLAKDREELKQHNLILLNNSHTPSRVSHSRVNFKNSTRRMTLTECDQGFPQRMSQLPYRSRGHQLFSPTSTESPMLSLTRCLNSVRK